MDADAVNGPISPTPAPAQQAPGPPRIPARRIVLWHLLSLVLAGWALLATLFYLLRFGFLVLDGGGAGVADLLN